MRGGAANPRGMSVRAKLLLLSAAPVLVTSGLLLALFTWSQWITSSSYEEALAWQRHANALEGLDAAARFYVDAISDQFSHDPSPHEAESRETFDRARSLALSLSRKFSAEEQAEHEKLDAQLAALIEVGDRVGRDRARLDALMAKYRNEIEQEIRRFVEEEMAGSARAREDAHHASRLVRLGGVAFALLAVLTAVIASVVAIRGFGGRVARLEKAAARVAAGDLETAAPVSSGDELGSLARSLNSMIEALRRQRTRQLGFLAAVAHDIRNPLAVMRLSADALLQATAPPPEPVVRRSFELVGRQIGRLQRMADDLVDAASIEAGQLKLELGAADVSPVARDVTELLAGSSPRHVVHLSVPAEPVVIVCDPTRIFQVLHNLVNNAIKYSPGGGTVDVTVTPGVDEVVLSVADTGLGIDPTMFDVIFEPFRRVSPNGSGARGVGLGLWICRRIVVAHGGRIEVASELGRGSKFEVYLPRQPRT